MLNYFRSILVTKNDQDPVYIGLVRSVLIIATLGFFAISVTLIFPLQQTPWGTVIGAVFVGILSGLALLLSYRHIMWPGKVLLPLAGLIAVTFICLTADGLHDTAIEGFALVIVITSLITGQKSIPPMTFLTLIGVWIVTYADMTGINHSTLASQTGWADVTNISIMLALVAGGLYALLNISNNSLDKAQANEQSQVIANRELLQLQTILEQRVTDRTRNLELAVEIGRTVSEVRDLSEMLRDAAEIIHNRFNLYYVQVYLIDPSRTSLILQSGTGAVGQELVKRGHSLSLNSASINGRAVIEKRPLIVEDTTASATFRPNPLLPETCAELAVPLMIGDRVVGVLDLQANQTGLLNQDTLPAFEALAAQLAIAIQNANLLAEAEQARREVENQARHLVRTGWQDYLDAVHKPERIGFVFEQNQILPLAEAPFTSDESQALTAPIAVTGESVGSLSVDIEESRRTATNSELVTIVARQVAQQIENLRLLESAERYRFESEQAAHRLTREGWKDYVDAQEDQKVGYLYDLNEIKPANQQMEDQVEKEAFSLPLNVRDETVGKLSVMGIDQNDSQAVGLARLIADRLGERIDSLRQFEQTQTALGQSERLFEASRKLTLATDLQNLLSVTIESLHIPAINRAIMTTLNYNAANELESVSVVANWWNGSGTQPAALGTRYSVGLALFGASEPIFVSDSLLWDNPGSSTGDERLDPATQAVIRQRNLRAGAVLPLYLGTRQIGSLLLEADQPHKFKQDETRLITALGPQITTVWENRRQFERAQRQAEREATLNAINQKIQSATSVDAVLQIAARELGHALGAPRTIAQLSLKDTGVVPGPARDGVVPARSAEQIARDGVVPASARDGVAPGPVRDAVGPAPAAEKITPTPPRNGKSPVPAMKEIDPVPSREGIAQVPEREK